MGTKIGTAGFRDWPRSSGRDLRWGLSGCTEPGGAASARTRDFCCGNGSWSCGAFPGCCGRAQAELKRTVGGSLGLAPDSSLWNLKWKNRNQAFPSLRAAGITTRNFSLFI